MNVGPQKSIDDREENSERVTPVEQRIHVKEEIPPDDHRIDHGQFIRHLTPMRQRSVEISRAQTNDSKGETEKEKSMFELVA